MEPCTREMQHFITDHDSQIQNASSFDHHHHHHHHPPAQEDFLETMMFSSLPVWGSAAGVDPAMKSSASCWDVSPGTMSRTIVDESSQTDPAVGFTQHFPVVDDDDESSVLASKLRQHQIGGSGGARTMMHHHQQQIMMMPLSLGAGGDVDRNDAVDGSPPSSSFKSPNSHPGVNHALYNAFTAGSLNAQPPSQTQHLPQANFSRSAFAFAAFQSLCLRLHCLHSRKAVMFN